MHIESASTWLCQNTIGFCGKVNKVVHGIHHIELEVHSGCCCKYHFFFLILVYCAERAMPYGTHYYQFSDYFGPKQFLIDMGPLATLESHSSDMAVEY